MSLALFLGHSEHTKEGKSKNGNGNGSESEHATGNNGEYGVFEIKRYILYFKIVGWTLYAFNIIELTAWVGLGFWIFIFNPDQVDIVVGITLDTAQIAAIGLTLKYVLMITKEKKKPINKLPGEKKGVRAKEHTFPNTFFLFFTLPTFVVVFFSDLFIALINQLHSQIKEHGLKIAVRVFSWFQFVVSTGCVTWGLLIAVLVIIHNIRVKRKQHKEAAERKRAFGIRTVVPFHSLTDAIDASDTEPAESRWGNIASRPTMATSMRGRYRRPYYIPSNIVWRKTAM